MLYSKKHLSLSLSWYWFKLWYVQNYPHQADDYHNTLASSTHVCNLILRITFQQMIHSQIFHQILYFPSKKKILKKIFVESFNISENALISVELAQVLQYLHTTKSFSCALNQFFWVTQQFYCASNCFCTKVLTKQ